ncbi:MAG TPA: PDZ domain-containing protein [Phycisphaerae bacterium]|nr:PDZ domain-containing protein [Phycisphaerae bacterium]
MRSIFVAVALLAVAGCNPYDILTNQPPAEGVSLPVKSDLFLAIDGEINDQPVHVLLDTGTIVFNLVPPSAIDRFGLVASGPNPYADTANDGVGVCGAIGEGAKLGETLYTAARLEIGGLIIENAAFVILEEEGVSTFDAIRMDCILNGSLLTRVDWRIDQGGERLTLFPLNTFQRPDGAVDLNVIGPEPPLLFALENAPRLGGISTLVKFGDTDSDLVETLMDTGGGVELALSDTLVEKAGWDLREMPSIQTGLFGAGGSCETTRFRAPRVRIGDALYEEIASVTLPAGDFGLIGWRFLANHEVVNVSPGGEWLELRKGTDTDANFETPIASFGFELALNQDGDYEVADVTPDSEAEIQGVQSGDIVRAVNGVSVDLVEGKSLLLGPDIIRAGAGVFTFENESGDLRDIELPAVPLL